MNLRPPGYERELPNISIDLFRVILERFSSFRMTFYAISFRFISPRSLIEEVKEERKEKSKVYFDLRFGAIHGSGWLISYCRSGQQSILFDVESA